MKRSTVIAPALAIFCILACHQELYVLPTADGGARNPSPPSLQGRVISVGPEMLVVKADGATGNAMAIVSVRLTPSTEMFTVYGGFVAREELSKDQRVRVWFTEPGV